MRNCKAGSIISSDLLLFRIGFSILLTYDFVWVRLFSSAHNSLLNKSPPALRACGSVDKTGTGIRGSYGAFDREERTRSLYHDIFSIRAFSMRATVSAGTRTFLRVFPEPIGTTLTAAARRTTYTLAGEQCQRSASCGIVKNACEPARRCRCASTAAITASAGKPNSDANSAMESESIGVTDIAILLFGLPVHVMHGRLRGNRSSYISTICPLLSRECALVTVGQTVEPFVPSRQKINFTVPSALANTVLPPHRGRDVPFMESILPNPDKKLKRTNEKSPMFMGPKPRK